MHALALKIDVDTLRGTIEGVPRLVELLRRYGVGATFLFSLGPDHTGRAIRRVFRPGFAKKVARTSVLEHYGLRTLLYGTLLPGPNIPERAGDPMRAARDAGFEVGVHTYDHVAWQDGLAGSDAAWVERAMRAAHDNFRRVFGVDAKACGAAGWQANADSLRWTQRLGYDYASDCRGYRPFWPVWRAEPIACPQVPTTLPTLDELIGRDGVDRDNVAGKLLEATRVVPEAGHVFTLHAELEGMKLAPVLETLVAGWRDQGYALVSVRDYLSRFDRASLPYHALDIGEVAGRSGMLAVQGAPFLAAA
jgi:undecaprenyl phosphate-alpha-L-ara4FN deformylase